MREKKELKTKRKTIRFTPKELAEILKKADEINMSFSNFIIHSALQKKITNKKIPFYKKFTTELGRIGNNLNQVSKILNAQKSLNEYTKIKLICVLDELQNTLGNIAKRLNNDL